MYTRYRFAAEMCRDKDVLEVACGSGQGLGYLASRARKVVGGDYDEKLVEIARGHYGGRIEISRIDAHKLEFPDGTFDAVILYEAIYYLAGPDKFVGEAFRVLKPGGLLIIGTANKQWEGFNPSPHSYGYFSADELKSLLEKNGFVNARMFADCHAAAGGLKSKVINLIKKAAVKSGLMPKTMKGKELFKRIFMGKLTPLPPEIKDTTAQYVPPVALKSGEDARNYKVIFCVGAKR